MPQFNFATFTGQIFWLIICFGILYYCISRIIIPRIFSIVDARRQRIKIDSGFATALQEKIDKTSDLAKKMRSESHDIYQKSIADILNKCASEKETAINKAKEDISKMSINSKKKIADLINNSKSEYKLASFNVADLIVKSIFGKKSELANKIEISEIKLKN